MEKFQGSSFIPKGPVRGTVKPRGVRRVYILTYVTYVLFFGTLLATAGVFMYGLSIDTQLVAEKDRLLQERESFNQADLERIRELELRMDTAFAILDRHVSLRSVLEALEATTLRPVQIYGFEYIKDIDNSLILTMTARTENFNNALFQREIFASNDVLNGATISELSFTEAELGDGSSIKTQEVEFTIIKELSVDEIPYTIDPFASDDSLTTTGSFTEEVEEASSVLDETLESETDVTDVIRQ